MPTAELLINPETGEKYVNVSPKIAAKYLGVSQKFVYDFLKTGKCPYGNGVQTDTGAWMFSIPVARLEAYANGYDITMVNQLLERCAL